MFRFYKSIFLIIFTMSFAILFDVNVQAKEAELIGSYNLNYPPKAIGGYGRIIADDGSIFYSNEYLEDVTDSDGNHSYNVWHSEFGRYDKYGKLLWRKAAPNDIHTYLQSVTPDLGVIVEVDYCIVKYDKDGNQLWSIDPGKWGWGPISIKFLTNDSGDRHLMLMSKSGRGWEERLCVLDKNGRVIKVLQEYIWSVKDGEIVDEEILYPELPVIRDLLYVRKTNGKYTYKDYEFSDDFETLSLKSTTEEMGKFNLSLESINSYEKEYFLSYIDSNSNVLWKKTLQSKILTSDTSFGKILQQSEDYCYLILSKGTYTSVLTVMKVDAMGNILWDVTFTVVEKIYIGGLTVFKRYDNGYIQIVNGLSIHHIAEPTPDLVTTAQNYKIGDNTKATLNISVINPYGVETEVKVYVGSTLKYSGSLGTTNANKVVEIDFGSVEGLLNVDFELYGLGRVIDSKTVTIDKYNLLNNLSNYGKTNINTLLIMNGSDRAFDNNIANQALIDSIKSKGLNTYIIHDSLNVPLTDILEE